MALTKAPPPPPVIDGEYYCLPIGICLGDPSPHSVVAYSPRSPDHAILGTVILWGRTNIAPGLKRAGQLEVQTPALVYIYYLIAYEA